MKCTGWQTETSKRKEADKNPFTEEGVHDGRTSVLTKISTKTQLPGFYTSDSESLVVIYE